MHGFRWLLVPYLLMVLLDGLLQSAIVAFLKVVVDRLTADPAAFVREHLADYTLLGLLGGVLFLLFAFGSHFLVYYFCCRLTMRFRLDLYDHLQKLSLHFYQQAHVVEIARLFLKSPPIVIFDEATSALDDATEALIQESMKQLLHRRTALIIAHRLSTVMACDRILMLDRGRIAGLGAHTDLLRTTPAYAALVRTQLISAAPAHPDHGVGGGVP